MSHAHSLSSSHPLVLERLRGPSIAAAAVALLASVCSITIAHAAAANARLCVFDPQGAGGDGTRAARDFSIEMRETGVNIHVQPFTNERVAVEEFRTGQCDAVMATGIRTRQFNDLAASLDAVGASTIARDGKVNLGGSYDVARRFIQILSSPKAANLMVKDQYEVAGIFPMGAAYLFTRDRGYASIQGQTGRRIAALDHDRSQAQLIARMGSKPVSADVTAIGPMFNNGNVDTIIVPTLAYVPFELQRGLGDKGAIIRMPLTISTYQMVIRWPKFPPGFGQKARLYNARHFDLALATLKLADKDIPERYWADLPPREIEHFQLLMRQGRVLMAEKGLYEKKGLKMVKTIRCQIHPGAAECSEPTEEW